MTETREGFEQERHEWYQVNQLLLDIGRASAELDLDPTDIIHIGGTANFYRSYQAFGPVAVMQFRGTHDMDLVCFNRGSVQRTMDHLQHDPESQIVDYSIGRAVSLPDKRSLYLVLDNKNPGGSSGFEIDIYESNQDSIRFNQRVFRKDRIILDPPETLNLPTHNPRKTRGLVTVPSLRDAFIIKMDVIDFSRSGLRLKDKIDALSTLAICQRQGCGFATLIDAVISTSSPESSKAKLLALEELFKDPTRDLRKDLFNNPLMPSKESISEALDMVRKGLKDPRLQKKEKTS